MTMFHVDQFQLDEAWIFFKLNDSLIRTETDGDFNVFCLMDAASQFILATEFISSNSVEPSQIEVKRMFKNALSHKQKLPEKLLVSIDQEADIMIDEATKRKNILLFRAPEESLAIFLNEARQGFQQHISAGMGL